VDTPKPNLSNDSLTPEQVAVYRAVLKDYTKEADRTLNLANKTDPMDQSSPMVDKACFKGIEAEAIRGSGLVVHRIDPVLIVTTRMTLVDPDRQQETIKKESNKKVWGMGFVTPETFPPIFRLDPELKSGLARRSGSAQPTPARSLHRCSDCCRRVKRSSDPVSGRVFPLAAKKTTIVSVKEYRPISHRIS